MSALDILQKARETLDSPDRFCQGGYALNEDGEFVEPEHASAVRFCIMGAVIRQSTIENWDEIFSAQDAIRKESLLLIGKDIATVNDSFGRAAVISVLDGAINKEMARVALLEEDIIVDAPEILARFRE